MPPSPEELSPSEKIKNEIGILAATMEYVCTRLSGLTSQYRVLSQQNAELKAKIEGIEKRLSEQRVAVKT